MNPWVQTAIPIAVLGISGLVAYFRGMQALNERIIAVDLRTTKQISELALSVGASINGLAVQVARLEERMAV